jgi:hypothetical protein
MDRRIAGLIVFSGLGLALLSDSGGSRHAEVWALLERAPLERIRSQMHLDAAYM